MKLEHMDFRLNGAMARIWRVSHTKRLWGPWCQSRTKAVIAWLLAGSRFARSDGRIWKWVTSWSKHGRRKRK